MLTSTPLLSVEVSNALTGWALQYLDAGAYERARRLLACLAELMPTLPIPRAGAALAAFLAGNPAAARDHLAVLEARFPKSPLRRKLVRLIRT